MLSKLTRNVAISLSLDDEEEEGGVSDSDDPVSEEPKPDDSVDEEPDEHPPRIKNEAIKVEAKIDVFLMNAPPFDYEY